MGRQLFVRASFDDEKRLISYLKSIADIKLIPYFADSKRELFQDNLTTGLSKHTDTYYIWNRAFAWNFETKKTVQGWFYVSHSEAPLIEFSRRNGNGQGDGRIYWTKYISAPDGLRYDVEAFGAWYDAVARWIRQNAAGKPGDGRKTYYLPGAWEELVRSASAAQGNDGRAKE